jgi:DNA-binding transcriptional ArsR family regulator
VRANLVPVAALLASPARAAMIEALFEGESLTASELAHLGGVGSSAASEHLGALLRGNLISVRRHGRNRYYELSNKRVAAALEAFAEICPPARVTSLRQATRAEALRNARTCYDHLAGRLGVAIFHALLARGSLVQDSTEVLLTKPGERAMRLLGLEIGAVRSQARPFARVCLDTTERRPHLGGALGAALATSLFNKQWIRRRPTGRGLLITPGGDAGIVRAFGFSLSAVVDRGGNQAD